MSDSNEIWYVVTRKDNGYPLLIYPEQERAEMVASSNGETVVPVIPQFEKGIYKHKTIEIQQQEQHCAKRRENIFKKLISEILDYCNLEDNWDTYNGVGASKQAMQFSVDLLKAIQLQSTMPAPRIAPISTGVYLEWRICHHLLYFEVDENSVLFVLQKRMLSSIVEEDSSFDVAKAASMVKKLYETALDDLPQTD